MSRHPIELQHGDDPQLSFTVRRKLADGTRGKYDFTGQTNITLYVYDNNSDENLQFSQAGSVSGDDTDGVCIVSVSNSDIPVPGIYWYRLRVTIGGLTNTIAYGPCTVIDI
jgi:hypothetical protein